MLARDMLASPDLYSQIYNRSHLSLQAPEDSVSLAHVYDTHKHKAVAYINTLPPEILRLIFRWAALSNASPRVSTKIRVSLTAVCCTWRILMRNDPLIWSVVSLLDHPELFKMFRGLAGDQPSSLSVFGLPKSVSGTATATATATDWSRIIANCGIVSAEFSEHTDALEVYIPSWRDDPSRLAIIRTQRDVVRIVNHVKYLHISKPDRTMGGPEGSRIENNSLFCHIIEAHALEHLNVSGFDVRSLSSLYHGQSLRTLHLSFLYPLRIRCSGWYDLLESLAPFLEDFRLEMHIPPNVEGMASRRTIRMSRLRILQLNLPCALCLHAMLTCMKLELAAEAKVQILSRRSSEFTWAMTAPFLIEQYGELPNSLWQMELMRDCFTFRSLNNVASASFRPMVHVNSSSHSWGLAEAWGKVASAGTDMRYQLSELMESSLKDRIVDLNMYEVYDPFHHRQTTMGLPWRFMEHIFPNIHTVTIATGPHHDMTKIWHEFDPFLASVGCAADTYHDIFVPRNIHSTLLNLLADDYRAERWFPALKTIRIKGHRLQRVTRFDGETQLLTFLQYRHEGNHPIEKIKLDGDCTISASFREAVAHVSPTTVIHHEVRQRRRPNMGLNVD